MDSDSLFAIADIARREAAMENGEDEPDENEIFVNPKRKIRKGAPTITPLDDGDFHVCFGSHCPHIALDREKQWVCSVTGLVVGVEHARDGDPTWTGRSTSSANPDDSAGIPTGGWCKRRDMYAASVQAHRNAHTISIDEVLSELDL